MLHDANVVHFDVKCDNIHLDPLPGASAADIAAPPSASPPFKVVLVDFGESRDFGECSRPALRDGSLHFTGRRLPMQTKFG